MKTMWWGMWFCIAMVALSGCGPNTECGEFPLDEDDRRCVVETIDTMVAETFPFADYKGVDLDEFSNSLWATVDEEQEDAQFLAAVNHALSMLQDGHTRMEQRYLKEPAVAPVEVREVDDELVVVSVDDPDHGKLVGQKIVAVDGVDAGEALSATGPFVETGVDGEISLSGPRHALAGEAGTTVELEMEGGQSVSMLRRSMFDEPQIERYNGNIGYLRLDTFGFIDDLERIDVAINDLMDTDGLMIDLRGNGGGYPSVTDGLFGRLIDEDIEDFELVGVDGEVYRKLQTQPRGKSYDGQVVVLVNGSSYSASNFFCHRMVYHNRGVLIGEQTGGGAASPKRGVMLLPGIWFQVSTHMVLDPDGVHKESGIAPALEVDVEDEAALRERGIESSTLSTGDPVKDRAIRYLEGLK